MDYRRWALAWLALCVAFAVHVIDEAANDFLSWYNANALGIRERLPWLPIPIFTFRVWVIALTMAVLALTALTPFARQGRRWLVPVAYVYAIVFLANGVAHIVVSVTGRWLAPGVYSAPLLLVAATWLLLESRRVATAGPTVPKQS
jgi:hypothetical protein